MYIIQEYQTDANGDTAIVTPVKKSKDKWGEAQNAFYQACAYAAISAVAIHTVCLTDEVGTDYDHKVFRHGKTEGQTKGEFSAAPETA